MTATASHDERLTGALRDAGLRVTSQRLVLNRALQELGRHATAEEIASAAGERLPGLSLPTVYATLELLERLGLVRRVSTTSGPTLFDPRTDAHEHFVCVSCGRVVDVPARSDTSRAQAAARRAGHRVEHVDVVLHGRCADCA
jgi:Fur family ferric uptake transcriptional regulator/Fur family peroxide stress response transcriptional regulator